MVLAEDKSRAVLGAAALLRQLRYLECSPIAIEKVRAEAERLLRTFPNKRDVNVALRAIDAVQGLHADE